MVATKTSLTCDSSVPLKHFLDLVLVDVKGIQVAYKNSGIDCLRILRVSLITNFAHVHHKSAKA
jgi:hypothetical protein